MAASATKKGGGMVVGGNGEFVEWGYITFDSDATVEVETALSSIQSAAFTPIGSGGNANTLSIDETIADGEIAVASGAFTVDATASNSETWVYRVWGH